MIEGKGLGGKRVVRVHVSVSNAYSRKLNRLATACGVRPTTLAGMLIERGLDDVKVIDAMQEELGAVGGYKVIPVQNYASGELDYIVRGDGD